MAEENSWKVLKFCERYEIYSEFPYPIRIIENKRVITEFEDGGYIRISINGKNQFKHRLIAIQFIENDDPETKTQIDHIDRNKLNNHISNLRWTSPSENSKNKDKVVKQTYEYVDKLPENAIRITTIDNFETDRYYYDIDNEQFYLETKWRGTKY